jgi:hypothetical protein
MKIEVCLFATLREGRAKVLKQESAGMNLMTGFVRYVRYAIILLRLRETKNKKGNYHGYQEGKTIIIFAP